MRERSGISKVIRAAVFIVTMLVGIVAALAVTTFVFGVNETGRTIANPDARKLTALAAIAPAVGLALLITKAKAGKWPAKIGGIAGLLLGLGAYLAIGIEGINAATEDTGHQVVAPIREVRTAGRSGNEFDILRVNISGQVTDLFWGKDYPKGAGVLGQCLYACTGIGRLGVRWIGERSIARCGRPVR